MKRIERRLFSISMQKKNKRTLRLMDRPAWRVRLIMFPFAVFSFVIISSFTFFHWPHQQILHLFLVWFFRLGFAIFISHLNHNLIIIRADNSLIPPKLGGDGCRNRPAVDRGHWSHFSNTKDTCTRQCVSYIVL